MKNRKKYHSIWFHHLFDTEVHYFIQNIHFGDMSSHKFTIFFYTLIIIINPILLSLTLYLSSKPGFMLKVFFMSIGLLWTTFFSKFFRSPSYPYSNFWVKFFKSDLSWVLWGCPEWTGFKFWIVFILVLWFMNFVHSGSMIYDVQIDNSHDIQVDNFHLASCQVLLQCFLMHHPPKRFASSWKFPSNSIFSGQSKPNPGKIWRNEAENWWKATMVQLLWEKNEKDNK